MPKTQHLQKHPPTGLLKHWNFQLFVDVSGGLQQKGDHIHVGIKDQAKVEAEFQLDNGLSHPRLQSVDFFARTMTMYDQSTYSDAQKPLF